MADSEVEEAREELQQLMDEFDADSPAELVRALEREIAALEAEMDEREGKKAAVAETLAEIDTELEELAETLEWLETDGPAT